MGTGRCRVVALFWVMMTERRNEERRDESGREVLLGGL